MLGISEDDTKIVNRISFGMIDGLIFLANTTGIETVSQSNLTKNFQFSNSVIVDRINKTYDIDIENGKEFPLLLDGEITDTSHVFISNLSLEDIEKSSKDTDEFVEEEILGHNDVVEDKISEHNEFESIV